MSLPSLYVALLQERPEDIPTGELPRSVQLVVDRHLVGQIAPGTRVTAYGIYSVYQARRLKHPWCMHLKNALLLLSTLLAKLPENRQLD